MAAQAVLVMDNLETVLHQAETTMADVVRWDVYTTGLQRCVQLGHGIVVSRLGVDGRFPGTRSGRGPPLSSSAARLAPWTRRRSSRSQTRRGSWR